MKKVLCLLLLVIMAVSCFSLSAQAAGKTLIVDDMDKLSQNSFDALNQYAQGISSAHDMDVAFFLVSHDYSPEHTLREHVMERFLDELGLGADGFALAHDTDGSTWCMVGFGRGEALLTDEIEDWFWDAYADTGTTYYDGILAYLEAAEDLLINQAAGDETPSVPGQAPAATPGDSGAPPQTGQMRSHVLDEADALTGSQIEALEVKAAALSEKRQCGVYIWIVDLVPARYAKSIDDMEVYVEAFYQRNTLGYGDDRNGMLLLLETGDEPGERDYLLYTHGACKSVFDNSTREKMLDESIVPLFKDAFNNGNFYKVADVFLDRVDKEYDIDFAVKLSLKLAAVILLPAFIAWIVCASWKRKMKTAVIARSADNYIPPNGFNLTAKTDQFLYRTTTRTRIERDSGSSGGSSSSSSGSSSGGKV